MRHRRQNSRLGRSSSHLKATKASLVRSLIERKRIRTTLDKAKHARRLAEQMVTLGRKGTLASRRRAISQLAGSKDAARIVATLFESIVPQFEGRNGGYTRIVRLGRRSSDSSEMAVLEWVDNPIEPTKKKKKKAEKAPAK